MCQRTCLRAKRLTQSMVVTMITPRQIRAARALLGWSQQQLADKAIVSLNAVAKRKRPSAHTALTT
jgi:ribosome-binding protein aMBF1 (putative translation factor)